MKKSSVTFSINAPASNCAQLHKNVAVRDPQPNSDVNILGSLYFVVLIQGESYRGEYCMDPEPKSGVEIDPYRPPIGGSSGLKSFLAARG